MGSCKESKKWFNQIGFFSPEEGQTILEPIGHGKGYWVGAPSIFYDDEKEKFYLYYRLRQPREKGLDRGFECRIAESQDGVEFHDIWQAQKTAFNSSSIERASLFKTPGGKYLLYPSYVDPEDNCWRIDVIESDTIEGFNISKRKKVFTAADIGAEGIKDPYVFLLGEKYYMIASYAPTPSKVTEELKKEMHQTADVYNTGKTKSHSGLAVSNDGINFMWQGDILSPGKGWDSYASRISCLVCRPPIYIAFYDGSSSVKENYEEKTGLAVSIDLRYYKRLTEEEPCLISPYSSSSLRYMDVVCIGNEMFYYYEYARSDGSHELRMNKYECG